MPVWRGGCGGSSSLAAAAARWQWRQHGGSCGSLSAAATAVAEALRCQLARWWRRQQQLGCSGSAVAAAMATGRHRLRPLVVFVVVCRTTGCVAACHLRQIEQRRHCSCHQGPSSFQPLPEILLFFALLLLFLLVLRVGPRWFLEIAMVQQVRLFTIAEAAISAASGFVTVLRIGCRE